MSGALVHEAFGRVMPDDMPSQAFLLLLVYCDHANPDGSDARPTIATVAWMVGCHEETARRHRKFWEQKGVLIETAWPRRSEEGWASAKVYRVDLSVLSRKDQPSPDVPGALGWGQPRISGDQPRTLGDQPSPRVPRKFHQRPLERPLERKSRTRSIHDDRATYLVDLRSFVQGLSDEEQQDMLHTYRPPIVEADGRFSPFGHKVVDHADALGLFPDGTPDPDGAGYREVAVAVLIAAMWMDGKEA